MKVEGTVLKSKDLLDIKSLEVGEIESILEAAAGYKGPHGGEPVLRALHPNAHLL